MRLANVDHRERRLILVALEDRLDVGIESAEGAAGEVAKDEHHWLLADELGKLHCLAPIGRLQLEVWSDFADLRSFPNGADLTGEQSADENRNGRPIARAEARGTAWD